MASSSAMYKVSLANLDTDWDDLFFTYWESWKYPLQAVGRLTFVGIGTDSEAERASYNAIKQQYLAAARDNPDQSWLKIENPGRQTQDHSQIIGGGVWTLYRDNPFRAPNHDGLDVPILPGPGFKAGTERDRLRKELYAQVGSWRRKHMATAHAYVQGLWVVPQYRHQGAAEAFMEFCTKKIDALGVEAYLEASSSGSGLFSQFGFEPIEIPTLIFHPDNPSPDWVNLVRDIQSHPISIMWRAQGGEYVEGKTVLPWDGRPRKSKL
ncbi:hypothetical protein F5Y18DRAFT_431445 [Xylariaceae sp. FL1019]|nr:hypothetical protein F5Y18DRAFT_431445 [Xylariaceae sp. FL1019]